MLAARLGLEVEEEAEEGVLSPLEEAAKLVDTCHFDVVESSGLGKVARCGVPCACVSANTS